MHNNDIATSCRQTIHIEKWGTDFLKWELHFIRDFSCMSPFDEALEEGKIHVSIQFGLLLLNVLWFNS